jgi:hypothetical protein
MEAAKQAKIRSSKLSDTISKLTTDDVLSPNAFWKLKKSISNLKLQAVYKRSGEVTTKEDEIKEEVRKEFEHRLRNRDPEPGWEGYVTATNEIVEMMLDNEDTNNDPFTYEEMEKVIKKMKTGIAPDYYGTHSEIIIHAGEGMLKSLLQVFNIIRTTKKTPEMWRNVLITMIYKNKGSHMDLEKYRGIFLTVIVSKVFERMLQNRMQPNLDKVSKLQSGSRSGRGPPDNLYLVRSCIDHHKFMNKPIYITAYDFKQAFDSLWIQDCILALRRLGVEDYLLQLIYDMNRKTTLQVKTPYGPTEPMEIKDIVKQGGILGSPMCSASTAEYCGVNKGILIGELQIATLAYVDDILDMNDTHDDTEVAHLHAQDFSKKKKLDYTPDKCNIMLINGKKKDKVPELFIKEEKVKEVQTMVSLGDVFNSKGNNEDLIKDRVKRGTAAMISVQGFMRETSLGVHTISVYLLLHNAIFLASILFNSQAWSNISEKNLEQLTITQLKFLKKSMKARPSTANSFVFLEMGTLPIKYELHKRQLSFLHHIVHLDDDDPVRKMWKHQVSMPDYNNWWTGVKKLMSKYSLELTEEQIKKLSKEAYKEKVKKAVKNQAFQELKPPPTS